MNAKPLYILGAGGLAREVAQLLHIVNLERFEFTGYIDRKPAGGQPALTFGRVVGDDAWLEQESVSSAVVFGMADPRVRLHLSTRFSGERYEFPNLVHPSSHLYSDVVSIGVGNVITVGTVFTCDIRIGSHNVFNWNVTVGHDVEIGSACVINPGANVGGAVVLEDGVLIGTGAQILQGRRIGRGAIVGAGAVVTRDVAPGSTVVGVPARQLVP